jgi:hypothetical protein
LLQFNPKERIGASDWNDVKNHPFFQGSGFDWRSLAKNEVESPLLSIIAHKMVLKKVESSYSEGSEGDGTDQPYKVDRSSDSINDWNEGTLE